MKPNGRATWLLPLLLGGCIDAQPTSPDFEQRVFSVLGGLSVGETLTLYGTSAESIVLQGAGGGARYVFIPFLAAEEGAVRLRVQVSGVDLVDPEAPSASRAALALLASDGAEAARAHLALREWEREVASPLLRGGAGAAARMRQSLAPVGPVRELSPGDLIPLRVPNRDPQNPDLCSNPRERTGRIAAVTEHAFLVEDTLNPVALTPADVQRIADEYETIVHPVAVENFGEPTDVDGNGRVYIFITSAVNENAQLAGGGLTVGFTFALDLVPRVSSTSTFRCDASNEAEIFYLIAPDPQAAMGVVVAEELVRRLTTGTIVHELQHMINFGRRLYEVENAESLEQVWLNEGLSHVAEELAFYAATGLRPRSNLGWEALNASAPGLDAYRRFVRGNMSNYANYLQSPENETLMGTRRDDDDFPTRGATWAFLRYLADQTPTADAELFRSLVNSPVAGLKNLEAVLGGDANVWMQRWTVASYTDDLAAQRIDERFTQPSWNFRSIYDGEIGGYPLVPRPMSADGSLSLNLRGGGSSFLLLRARPGHQARVNTTRTGPAVFGELRVSVVRVE